MVQVGKYCKHIALGAPALHGWRRSHLAASAALPQTTAPARWIEPAPCFQPATQKAKQAKLHEQWTQHRMEF
eukprot:1160094-Pelagomonas_calceolata.AAC.11